MRFWVGLDEELVGSLDESGCFHDPLAVNRMLSEYGIRDGEARRVARRLLRWIGVGRAEGLDDDDDSPDRASEDDDAESAAREARRAEGRRARERWLGGEREWGEPRPTAARQFPTDDWSDAAAARRRSPRR